MSRQDLRNRRPAFTCGHDRTGRPLSVPPSRLPLYARLALLAILSAVAAEPLLRALL